MDKNYAINISPRTRVLGKNGPRRHELTCFGTIDSSVPKHVIDKILELSNNYSQNDLGADNYQISQHCDLTTAFKANGNYRQILLQEIESGSQDVVEETNYTKWRNDIDISFIREYLESKFTKVYRSRISIMPPGHELNWHIDTDTSVLCRLQIPAQSKNSEFQFRTRTNSYTLSMSPQNAYFINTGWLHRVVNNSNETRIVLIAGIAFDDIPNKETLKI